MRKLFLLLAVTALVTGTGTSAMAASPGPGTSTGTGSVFVGNILALTSIAVTTGVTVEGRVLGLAEAPDPDQL